MAPTPYNAGWQLDLHYDTGTFTHVLQMPVLAHLVTGTYFLVRQTTTDIGLSTAATAAADILKPMFANTCTFTGWTLQEYDSGIFIPRASGSLAIAGTGAGALVPGSQITVTFRDINYLFYRLVLLDTAHVPPNKYSYPTGNTAIDNAVSSWYTIDATTDVGQWIRSRNGGTLANPLKVTLAYNKRLVRKYGLN